MNQLAFPDSRSIALFLSLSMLGCGVAYQPASNVKLDLDPAAEINDEDVLKAFAAQPQLGKPVRVAYFAFDAAKADAIDTMLHDQPGVSDVYRIPTLMMTGGRRFDRVNPWAPKEAFSIKKARLLAARAKADVLLVFDNGYRSSSSPNGWFASVVLIVPLLLTPWLDFEVESYLETYVIDTRNGYVYAHVTADQKGKAEHRTIYSSGAEALEVRQWSRLLADTKGKIAQVFAREWARTAEMKATPPTVTAPGTSPSGAAPTLTPSK